MTPDLEPARVVIGRIEPPQPEVPRKELIRLLTVAERLLCGCREKTGAALRLNVVRQIRDAVGREK